jgi:hypothetical protein
MRFLPSHSIVAGLFAFGAAFSASADSGGHGGASAKLSSETIAARQHYFGLDNVDPKTGFVRSDRVILSWTGVSGFAAAFRGTVVLMDAYVARDGGVLIQGQPLGIWPSIKYIGSTPEEMAALKPELVLLGHTHFDHAGDLPAVIRGNPGSSSQVPQNTAQTSGTPSATFHSPASQCFRPTHPMDH